jgi:hypothetical protein
MAITTTITVDGKEVTLRASAAVPRLYRIKFRRDIIVDMQAVARAVEDKDQTGQDIPLEALALFENMAYIMAKHGDKDAVPDSPDEWLEEFSTFSIYKIFPVLKALWEGNMEALDVAKKKLEP